MMVPDAKKCKADKNALAEEEDRISNLPRHLIHCILDCMLINDAARTSVLSKTWADIWETYPHLILKEAFFEKLVYNKDKQAHRCQLSDAICMILFALRGPILKFRLYMPPELRLHESPLTHLWMKQLSDRGIRDLELTNAIPNRTSIVSSHLFSCSELTDLNLFNWQLNPPRNFGGYRNLAVVFLTFVTLTRDLLFGAQVKVLSLIGCAGIQYLDSQFRYKSQNLVKLDIRRSEKFENKYSRELDFNPFTNIMKSINLYKLLSHILSVTDFTLNDVCLKFLDPGLALHKKLTTDMRNLKRLVFSRLNFNDMCQILNAFCLIRSSPNLQFLCISVNPEVNKNPIEHRTEPYLESPDCMNIILDQLQTVDICNVMGSRAELLFMKLVLAIAASLRRMTLLPSPKMNDPKDEVRILRELLQCPRRSPVQIFWSGTIYT